MSSKATYRLWLLAAERCGLDAAEMGRISQGYHLAAYGRNAQGGRSSAAFYRAMAGESTVSQVFRGRVLHWWLVERRWG